MKLLHRISPVEWCIIAVAMAASTIALLSSLANNYTVAYGDAESHLNIAKRVLHSLTPGFAQLGGIWLPLPHLMMIPFVYVDALWQSGIAGWIVSGAMYVIGCVYMYKFTREVTGNTSAALVATFVFGFNPNLLYMQTTAMTEPVLITFMIISIHYFVRFLKTERLIYIIAASFFCLMATLSRYDGWFLAIMQTGLLAVFFFMQSIFYGEKKLYYRRKLYGMVVMFATVAFLGIIAWSVWGFIILGDPFYFTNSPFSAKSQQQGWLAKDMLPTYKNIQLAVAYFTHASIENVGRFISLLAVAGLALFTLHRRLILHTIISLLLMAPFFFNVLTLYIGQSVIFIPSLTPEEYEYNLFNVRYGLMMLFPAAFYTGYLLHRLSSGWIAAKETLKPALTTPLMTVYTYSIAFGIIGIVLYQFFLFYSGEEWTISLADAVVGLSGQKEPDAQQWLRNNYDEGLILVDDYSRTVSIIHSNLPIDNVIYVGNRHFWDESLREPEKHATWIIMLRDDAIWKSIYEPEHMNQRLYAHFEKAYTSDEILIFRRIAPVPVASQIAADP